MLLLCNIHGHDADVEQDLTHPGGTSASHQPKWSLRSPGYLVPYFRAEGLEKSKPRSSVDEIQGYVHIIACIRYLLAKTTTVPACTYRRYKWTVNTYKVP